MRIAEDSYQKVERWKKEKEEFDKEEFPFNLNVKICKNDDV